MAHHPIGYIPLYLSTTASQKEGSHRILPISESGPETGDLANGDEHKEVLERHNLRLAYYQSGTYFVNVPISNEVSTTLKLNASECEMYFPWTGPQGRITAMHLAVLMERKNVINSMIYSHPNHMSLNYAIGTPPLGELLKSRGHHLRAQGYAHAVGRCVEEIRQRAFNAGLESNGGVSIALPSKKGKLPFDLTKIGLNPDNVTFILANIGLVEETILQKIVLPAL
eukprot:GHVN01096422.1.p1 GENE.GHVN01096422.1~~GHVN01096422.1.p1  ORF type:complete len:226 (-),score=11.69 GHVN01096422.1:240-917(-)